MKLYFTLLFTMVFSVSQAQNFVFSEGPHVIGEITGQFEEFNIAFNNSPAKAITYKWEIVENTFPDAWDFSLCDYANCYFSIPDTGEMWPISEQESIDGKRGFFKLNFLSSEEMADAKLVIYVYEGDNKLKGDTVSFSISRNTTAGVSDLQLSTFVFGPNPAQDHINVRVSTESEIHIEDLQGKTMLTRELAANKPDRIDVSNLGSGLYVCRIVSNGIEVRRIKLSVY